MGLATMAEHKVGSREEWLAARTTLLEREKELTRRSDELARERLELPWVAVDKDYSFETDDGPKSLAELFDGRPQLAVYNFMFGPEYDAGCPVCSSMADGVDGVVPHLNERGVTFWAISRAPLEQLRAYKQRMGWRFPWASSAGSDFNFDMDASRSREVAESFFANSEVPPLVNQFAEACGTDVGGYVSEGPVSARSRLRTASSTRPTRPPRAESSS
jgi:predicted dithiol-disulfide oxidoreductase (DUF899 family)